jgi:hypothetical protein
MNIDFLSVIVLVSSNFDRAIACFTFTTKTNNYGYTSGTTGSRLYIKRYR